MRQKGLSGEVIAASFLKKLGYRVVAKNFHSRFGEIDLIVVDRNIIVFVEVKLRSSDLFGTPLEAITYSKLNKMQKTAFYYLATNNISDSEYRFDAVEIIVKGDKNKINHVKNITL